MLLDDSQLCFWEAREAVQRLARRQCCATAVAITEATFPLMRRIVTVLDLCTEVSTVSAWWS